MEHNEITWSRNTSPRNNTNAGIQRSVLSMHAKGLSRAIPLRRGYSSRLKHWASSVFLWRKATVLNTKDVLVKTGSSYSQDKTPEEDFEHVQNFSESLRDSKIAEIKCKIQTYSGMITNFQQGT